VVLRGNVVPVSHGESKTEDVGSSDGVTAHQLFSLKNSPVTWLPRADGAEIELEIRVSGVLWDLVEDFHEAPPEGRFARALLDADQAVAIAFGGEGRGAVPPAGRRNITAEYRVGLGRIGDAEAGRLTRIRKSSPLLDAVTNPLPLVGGTDPASTDDMRRQATRPILTFDRAVSVQDHADLALLYPGVARTASRWLNRGAVELIAADAAGEPPSDPAALRAYLDARRDDQVPLVLLTPQPVGIGVTLRVERDRAWLADAVRLAVTEALIGEEVTAPGLFTFAGREFSEPQSLSGLYRLLLRLPGATGIEASRFAILPGTGVADILHATDRQWLRLLPTDLVIEIAEPGTLITDVGEVGP
jgi:predicted phage baseplate assembly protein